MYETHVKALFWRRNAAWQPCPVARAAETLAAQAASSQMQTRDDVRLDSTTLGTLASARHCCTLVNGAENMGQTKGTNKLVHSPQTPFCFYVAMVT